MKRLISALFLLVASNILVTEGARAFHGYEFRLKSENRSIIVYFDPIEGAETSWGYLSNPSGFLSQAFAFTIHNRNNIGKLENDFRIFITLDADGNGQYIVTSIAEDGTPQFELEHAPKKPIGKSTLDELLCKAPIQLSCSYTIDLSRPVTLVDGASDIAIDAAKPTNPPLVTFGPLGAPPQRHLFLLGASVSPDVRAKFSPNALKSGTVQEVLPTDGWQIFEAGGYIPGDKQVPQKPGKQGSSQYNDIDRSGFPDAKKLDPRLKFIVLHCTAVRLSRRAILRIKANGSRGKGHIYIMPNGELIEIWPIETSPNTVFATKTEYKKCKETMGESLRTMYHVELNYDCHWNPSKSPDPSSAQMQSLAQLIAALFRKYGPFHIKAHTYVDMGINSSLAHTDPQGRGGFDYASLWQLVKKHGGMLGGIVKVEQKFAQKYKVSKQEIQHNFPAYMNRKLPIESLSSPDECHWHGR